MMRVMVLGHGNFGHSWATHVVPACSGAVLCAAVDKEENRFQGVEAPCFTDWRQALADARPELAVNATPPDVHVPLAKELVGAGCAVLCEKPIASCTQDALDLARFCAAGSHRVAIAENYRYHPGARMAGEIIASGKLGGLRVLSCRFSHYHPDYSRFYHGQLAHPLLLDVSMHHLPSPPPTGMGTRK